MHISSAVPQVARNDLAARFDATAESVVQPAVRDLLLRSPAFAALDADRQRAVAAGTVSVAEYLVAPADLASQANEIVHAVDFPAFVAGLVQGVFDAIVDA